jgi:hypothetical protein
MSNQAIGLSFTVTAAGPTPGVGGALPAGITLASLTLNAVNGNNYNQGAGVTDATPGTADAIPAGPVPVGGAGNDVWVIVVNMATDSSTLDVAIGNTFDTKRPGKSIPAGAGIIARCDCSSAGPYIKGSSASVPFVYLLIQA